MCDNLLRLCCTYLKMWAKASKNGICKVNGPANGLAGTVTIHKSSEDGIYLGD